jgi:hypothetical protein
VSVVGIVTDASPDVVLSSDAGGADRDRDAGTDAVASGDAPSDSPSLCNTLELGQAVVATQTAEAAPQPQGGIIGDGTYTLSSVTIYTGPNGPLVGSVPEQEILQIAGNTWQTAYAFPGIPAWRFTETVAANGTTLSFTPVCFPASLDAGPGGSDAGDQHYTATASSLILFGTLAYNGSLVDAESTTFPMVYTLTKQ